jgi:iron complex transport system permease protein
MPFLEDLELARPWHNLCSLWLWKPSPHCRPSASPPAATRSCLSVISSIEDKQPGRVTACTDEKQMSALTLPWLAAALLPAVILSLLLGRYPISMADASRILGSMLGLPVRPVSRQVETVLLYVRLPRVTVAVLVGTALSVSGAAFQGIFRNAIVSPDLLGASSGAGFGAAVAILLSFGPVSMQIAAFVCGTTAVLIAYGVSLLLGRSTVSLLLSGVAVAALFSAFTSMTKLVADPMNKLPAITFWLMGGLSNVTVRDVPILFVTTLLGATPLILLRWRLNIVALGEDHALALGMQLSRFQPLIVACATLLTASTVAVCGLVGWVGLLVPNIARLLVGPRFERLLPASIFLGATFVLLVDDLSRTLFAAEIPLGVLLALLGAPFLLFMLARYKVGHP